MARKVKRTKAKTRKAARGRAASVVPAKYRDRYEDGSCGDDVALRLKRHITADDGSVDVAKLKALAQRNGVWLGSYEKLNAGLARMIVGNRLRHLARAGTKIVWE
jgi:hypothetical protein